MTKFIYKFFKKLIYCFVGLDDFIKFHDVLVTDAHQDLDLALDIANVVMFDHRATVDFYCDFPVVVPVYCAFYQGVSSFTQVAVELYAFE